MSQPTSKISTKHKTCPPAVPLIFTTNKHQYSADPYFIASLRFLLQLTCQSPVLEAAATFSVVETNAFKHLNHLCLRLVQGSDKEVKDYLAACLSSLKVCFLKVFQ